MTGSNLEPAAVSVRRNRRLMSKKRRPSRMLLAAMLLVATALQVTGTAPARAATSPLITISGPTPFSSCQTSGSDTLFVNAETAPVVAANPATVGTDHVNVLAAWEQDRWQQINMRGIAGATSFDGGKTWARTVLPFGQCASPASKYDRVGAPWVTFGPDGIAYAVARGTKADGNAIFAATSSDGGRTWRTASTTITEDGSNFYNNDPKVTADPKQPGTAYIVWNRTDTSGDDAPEKIWAVKTTDGGKTWTKPTVVVDSPTWTFAVNDRILIDPRNGTLYLLYQHASARTVTQQVCHKVKVKGKKKKKKVCQQKQVVPPNPDFDVFVGFVKSSDGGQTWSRPSLIRKMLDYSTAEGCVCAVSRLSFYPISAIDPTSGKIYAAVEEGTFTNGDHPEISVMSSGDGGATWSQPTRINADLKTPALIPSIAVNTIGVVGVTYYDFRHATADKPSITDYWFISSSDGGAHFDHEQHLGGPFDMLGAPLTRASTYYVGGYQGLTAVGSSFLATFVMANAGTKDNPTDVFATTITP